MRTPKEKFKKAERMLKLWSAASILLGLIFISYPIFSFLKYGMLKTWEWNEPVPAEVYHQQLNRFRVAIYGIMPTAAFINFLVGYTIWDYRRKRDNFKEQDTEPKPKL